MANEIDIESLPVKIAYVGETKRNDWECFAWRVEISSKAGFWSTDYFTGKGLTNKFKGPKKPTIADVLHSLLMDAGAVDQNFHDWCAEYGHSDDSIKALNTYKACLEIGTNLRKHFSREVADQLREQLADH